MLPVAGFFSATGNISLTSNQPAISNQHMSWNTPQRPLEYAEEALVSAILDGTFPIGGKLPSERKLAAQLGVTRPTLREALRRLERDGWLTIQQGKSTLINDYWRDGGTNIISTLVQHTTQLPENFVLNLLEIRRDLAPSYMEAAVRHHPAQVVQLFESAAELEETAEAYAQFDWQMHHELTVMSTNPVYTLIMNGFSGFYVQMAQLYFAHEKMRQASQTFYGQMVDLAAREAVVEVRPLVAQVMTRSIVLWQQMERAGRVLR